MPKRKPNPGKIQRIEFKTRRLAVVLCLSAGLTATLDAAHAQKVQAADTVERSLADIRLAPGDDKAGYRQRDYQTDSLSLEFRAGRPADLLAITKTPQLGLPPLPAAEAYQPDASKIALGRKLFFDRRLSRNKTMSCAMCHIPEQGFTNNELARPIGFEGRSIKRNAPTILNVAYYQRLFADARESTLEQQVWAPLLAENEMNNASVGMVIETIRENSEYNNLFEQAFGAKPNMLNIGLAIAHYERALLAANSRFDQWYFGDQPTALNAEEIEGFRLFTGKAGCSRCHLLAADHALFTDQLLHNTGVGYADSMQKENLPVAVQLAPGMITEVDRRVVDSVGERKPNDLGRYEITLDPSDRWKYRTPSLRNIALTAPYMHDGKFLSLEAVLAFYNKGGEANELLSPLIQPLNLSAPEQSAITMFLKSLTGSNVRVLVADAFAVPIGDIAIPPD